MQFLVNLEFFFIHIALTPMIFPFSAFFGHPFDLGCRVAAAATIKFCDDVSEKCSSLRHAPPATQVIGLEINCVVVLLLKSIKSIPGMRIVALTNVHAST